MIHLLFTGGTISMTRDERAGGNLPTHGGEALVAHAPELQRLAPLHIEDWGRYPACHMGPDKLWELRNRVAAISRQERPTGIVITHGTDTIEETAYLLARTLDSEIPVAITGAMRTSSDPGWDGPDNLTAAARVAADPASRGRGTMVVFAGKIFAGHQAAKIEATALEAFGAPHAGPIGEVRHGRVDYTLGPQSCVAPHSSALPHGLTARVALIPMIIGDQGELLDLARPIHDGVVLMAFGAGNLPPGALPAVRRWLAEGKPVVLSTRCPRGQVTPIYAFPGGGATLVREGVIPAGPRTPSQARMELVISLSAGVGYGEGW
ncbi:MAG TPA: asparaginase, partial [Gemmatimonadales bacterium]|nr:asparaginase [Gemmatimonadales bacterium]